MKRFTSRFHKIKRSHFKAVGLTCLISMLAFPALSYGSKEHAFYKVFVGDKQVGVVSEKETALDALQEAKYMIETQQTIREIAVIFNVSKSTAHKDLHERLINIDKSLSEKVEQILKYHTDIRHIRGGESTKRKYLKR